MNTLSHRRWVVLRCVLAGWLAGVGTTIGQIEVIEAPDGDAPNPAPALVVPGPKGTGSDAAESAGRETTDLLRFRNGDALHGTLVGLPGADKVLWHHPDTDQDVAFSARNILQVQLAGRAAPAPPGLQASVRLTNGDELHGKVAALDAEKLVLETWYAGPLTIRRAVLESISTQAVAADTLFAGPTGTEGWHQSRQQARGWRYSKGAFYSAGQGAIGRDIKLPAQARLEFDLAWRNFPYFMLSIYTGNLEQSFSEGYILQWSGNTVYLQRAHNHDVNNLGGATTLDDLQQRTKSHVTLLVDKQKKSLALLVDGALVKQWVDPGEFAGTGTGILLQSQGQGMLRVSNIRLSAWDGEVSRSEGVTGGRAEDLIRLVNNDKVSGQLKGIANGKVTFVTSYAALEIPFERALTIQLASDKAERARRQTADIRGLFVAGGSVTLAVEKLDGQALTGSSENFGRQTFARQAFRELQFHIYDETTGATEDDWEF